MSLSWHLIAFDLKLRVLHWVVLIVKCILFIPCLTGVDLDTIDVGACAWFWVVKQLCGACFWLFGQPQTPKKRTPSNFRKTPQVDYLTTGLYIDKTKLIRLLPEQHQTSKKQWPSHSDVLQSVVLCRTNLQSSILQSFGCRSTISAVAIHDVVDTTFGLFFLRWTLLISRHRRTLLSSRHRRSFRLPKRCGRQVDLEERWPVCPVEQLVHELVDGLVRLKEKQLRTTRKRQKTSKTVTPLTPIHPLKGI